MRDKNSHSRGNALAEKPGATNYHAYTVRTSRQWLCRAIKELVVCRTFVQKSIDIRARLDLTYTIITPSGVSRPTVGYQLN